MDLAAVVTSALGKKGAMKKGQMIKIVMLIAAI